MINISYKPLPFQHTELSLICALSLFRTSFFNNFFLCCDWFDNGAFFMLLFPLVIFGIQWQWGIRLYVLFQFQLLSNQALKFYFLLPRPCQLVTSLGLLCFDTPGMPSSAAMSAVLLPGLLIYAHPRWWTWLGGSLFWFLLSFSRIYLGVHFISDVFGGWLLAAILLMLFIILHQSIESFLAHVSPVQLLVITTLFPLSLLFFDCTLRALTLIGRIIGVGMGFVVRRYYCSAVTNPKNICDRILGTLLGVAGLWLIQRGALFILAVSYFDPALVRVGLSFFTGLFLSFIAPYLLRRCLPLGCAPK